MKHGTRNGIGALLLAALLAVGSLAVQAAPSETDGKSRAAQARAMFAERCKSAGEFIHRTVENVEGVYLLKLRPKEINFGDQFRMDDPYGADVSGDGYIVNFLLGRNLKGSLVHEKSATFGYHYVEALDPADGKRYRYTGRSDEPWQTDKSYLKGYTRFVLDKHPAPGASPRYGVTYDDISTREEREYWIAGSSLKVIDLTTNEVIAERIGYMMDRGQGAKGGGRSPWLWAADVACPPFPKAPGGNVFKGYQTRNFVEKVLHIKQGD